MVTRRAAWTAYGITGAILLAAGFWGGKSVSPGAVTPDVLAGTVRTVAAGGDAFVIRLDGRGGVTTYAMRVSPVMWRDKYGNWFQGTQPACPEAVLSRPAHHLRGGQRQTGRGDRRARGRVDRVRTQPCAPVPGRDAQGLRPAMTRGETFSRFLLAFR